MYFHHWNVTEFIQMLTNPKRCHHHLRVPVRPSLVHKTDRSASVTSFQGTARVGRTLRRNRERFNFVEDQRLRTPQRCSSSASFAKCILKMMPSLRNLATAKWRSSRVVSVNRDDKEARVKLGCMRSDSFMGRILWLAGVLFLQCPCDVGNGNNSSVLPSSHRFDETNFCLKDLIDVTPLASSLCEYYSGLILPPFLI